VDKAAGRGVKNKNAGKAEVFVELSKIQSLLSAIASSSVSGVANRYREGGCGGAFIRPMKN
jgi:hypothetical protein